MCKSYFDVFSFRFPTDSQYQVGINKKIMSNKRDLH